VLLGYIKLACRAVALAEGEGWWRRRESNPRPKSLSARRIHAQSSSGWFRRWRSERTRCVRN